MKAPQNKPEGKNHDKNIIVNLSDNCNGKIENLRAVQMLNSNDLMALLGIKKSAFYQLKSTGKLPRPVRIGTIQRWRLADVERWLEFGCPSQQKFEVLRKAGK